jgi:hypothetical protein
MIIRLFILSLAALVLGCTTQPAAESTGDYYRDGQHCRAESMVKQRIKLNSIRQSQEVQLGADASGYVVCMERLGWKPDPGADPLLRTLKTCREEAEGTGRLVAGAEGTRLTPKFDRTIYEDCLKREGVDGDVIIEPLQPRP